MLHSPHVVLLFGALCLLVFIPATVLNVFLERRRRSLIRAWFEERGWRVHRVQWRMFAKGPFPVITLDRGRAVYCVNAADPEGRSRVAWVRAGWWTGWFDNPEVRWEE